MAEELANRRALEIAAVWGNINMDSEEKPHLRQEFQQQIEENYSKAIASLYSDTPTERPQEDEPDMSDPFWQAMQRGIQSRELPKPKPPE